MYFRHLVLAACLLLLSGCGIIDYFFLPPPEDTAQELYEGANDAMQEKNYSQAAQYYTKLKDNFPFSPYTVEAELSLGDAFFLDGKSGDRRGLRLCRRPVKNLNLFILAMRLSHTSCTRWGCPT